MKPLYSGHPWDVANWLLYKGGLLIQRTFNREVLFGTLLGGCFREVIFLHRFDMAALDRFHCIPNTELYTLNTCVCQVFQLPRQISTFYYSHEQYKCYPLVTTFQKIYQNQTNSSSTLLLYQSALIVRIVE